MAFTSKCSSIDELNSLCSEVANKANQLFDTLIKDCKIDINNNKLWASEYYSLVKSNNKLQKQIRRLKIWRWVLLIFLIFPFFLMTNSAKKKQILLDNGKPQENNTKVKLDSQLKDFVQLLSYNFMFKKIIEPVWSDISFDIYQDGSKFSSWKPLLPKFINENTCFLELISGTFFSNPFMLYNYKEQIWYMHTYTESKMVTYTDHDSQGHMVTRTEVVTASVTLPAPKWNVKTEFVYHFDKASKLCFANNSSKKELKKLNKKYTQIAMENKQFEKLFPCKRNDEKKFRIVFTPLAQENYVKLLSNQQYTVIKNEEITTVQIPSVGSLLDTTDNETVNYDITTWKNQYSKWVSNFVHTIGILSLPISCIPLYTQFKTNVHSSQQNKNVASDIQVQENIYLMFNSLNIWSKFDTDVIFETKQTKFVNIGKLQFSITEIKCNYFWPEHSVVMQPAMSIHRGSVMVPVHVTHYRPRSKNYYICQTTNLNNDNIELPLNNGILIHRGQIILLSDKPNISTEQINAINNLKIKN